MRRTLAVSSRGERMRAGGLLHCVVRRHVTNSSELRIQKDELGDIGVVGLQLHRIGLIAGRVAAAVPQVKRSL
jgi:hypothetical protein